LVQFGGKEGVKAEEEEKVKEEKEKFCSTCEGCTKKDSLFPRAK
jgi:hypothetical protein